MNTIWHREPTSPATLTVTIARRRGSRRRFMVAALAPSLMAGALACSNQNVDAPAPEPGSTILALLPVDNRQLDIGEEHRGTLSSSDLQFDGSRFQAWSVEVEPGVPMVVDLSSNDFPPTLHIVGPGVEQKDIGIGGAARICFESDSGGTYSAAVTTGGTTDTGSFVIRARPVPDAVTPNCDDPGPREIDNASEESVLQLFLSMPTQGRELVHGTSEQRVLSERDAYVIEGDTIYLHSWVFDGGSGDSVVIDVSGDGLQIGLAAIGHGLMEENDGRDDVRLLAQLPTGGEYRAIVASLNGPGEYAVRFTRFGSTSELDRITNRFVEPQDLPVSGTPVAANTPIKGVLSAVDPLLAGRETYAQAFEFQANRGESVIINLRSDDFDTYLYVLGNGVDRQDDDGGTDLNSRIQLDVPVTGTYRAVVTGLNQSDIGDFELSTNVFKIVALTALPTHGRRLTLDTTVIGILSENDQPHERSYVQAWSLQASQHDTVVVDLMSEEFDARLYVRGPSIQLENDDGPLGLDSRLVFEAPEDGVYRVIVSSLESNVGCFAITVSGSVDQQPRNECKIRAFRDALAGELSVDSTVNSRLNREAPRYQGELLKTWTVQAAPGDSLIVEVTGGSLQGGVSVLNPNVDFAELDATTTSGDARLFFIAPDRSEYVVAVHSAEPTDPFEIVLRRSESPDLATLPVGDRVLRAGRASLGQMSWADQTFGSGIVQAWAFEGRAGETLSVDFIPDGFSANLHIVGPGVRETVTGGAGPGYARTSFLVPSTDTLRLVVESPDAATGCFSIKVSRNADEYPTNDCRVLAFRSANPREFKVGTVASDTLRRGQLTFQRLPIQTWRFRAEAGDSMIVTLDADGFRPALYVVGPGLDIRSENRAAFRVPRTAVYHIAATTTDRVGGSYTLELQKLVFPDLNTLPTDSLTLGSGRPTVAEWTSEDASFGEEKIQAWSFTATRGDSLRVDLATNSANVTVRVIGHGLDLERQLPRGTTTSSLEFVAPTDGEYRVFVRAQESDLTCYAVRVVTNPLNQIAVPDCTLERFRRLPLQHTLVLPESRRANWHVAATWDLPSSEGDFGHTPAQAWVVRGRAGDSITVDLISSDFNAVLHALESETLQLLSNDDGAGNFDSRLSLRFATDGEFRLIATSYQNRGGCYRLLLWQRSSAESPRPQMTGRCEGLQDIAGIQPTVTLDTGQVVKGEFAVGRGGGRQLTAWNLDLTDWNPTRPMVLTLHSDDFDPRLHVFDLERGPFGAMVDDNGSNQCNGARIVLDRPSRYMVVVSEVPSTWSRGNAFTIRASESRMLEPPRGCVPFLRSLEARDTLIIGTTGAAKQARGSYGQTNDSERRNAELTGDRRTQSFSVTTGGLTGLTIDVTSEQFDPYFSILGRDNVQHADDGLRGCGARLSLGRESLERLGNPLTVVVRSFRPSGEGQYTIEARSDAGASSNDICDDVSGDFRSLADLDVMGRPLQVDGIGTSGYLSNRDTLLADGTHAQAWTLMIDRIDTFSVELRSNDFDAFLRVGGPGIPSLTDDDGAGGCHARVTWLAPKAGLYRVIVNTIHSGETGAFQLRVFSGSPSQTPSMPCRMVPPR